jgi:hypothetical protein
MDEGQTPPDPQLLAVLARELATERLSRSQLLEKFGLTEEHFEARIASNAYFQKLLAAYTAEWENITNTNKRLSFHAAAALEQELPVLQSRMGDRRENFNDAVQAAKVFKEIAGIGPPAPGHQGSGEKFTISINLGTAAPVKLEVETPKEKPLLELPYVSSEKISKG